MSTLHEQSGPSELPSGGDASPPDVVEVFILHWNRPEECRATVDAFLRSPLSLRITVIDNASHPRARAQLKADLPTNVRWVQRDENEGWGRGFNPSLHRWVEESSSGELALISAHDALPVAECLATLVNAMRSNPDVGIMSPEYGLPQLPKYSAFRGARLLSREKPGAAGTVERFDFVHGTLMCMRKSCLRQIGLFDERYFAYGDETEIGLRANRFGWKTAVLWGAVVVNPGTWTPSGWVSYLWGRNSLMMARAYGGTTVTIFRTLGMAMAGLCDAFRPISVVSSARRAARWYALRDYWLKRWGRPKSDVLAKLGGTMQPRANDNA